MGEFKAFATTRRVGNTLGFSACAGMMAFALYEQYAQGLEPCHLCILQRIAVSLAGALFLLAGLHAPRRVGAAVYGGLVWLALGFGMLAAGRNVWVQWQPAGAVPACGAPLNLLIKMMPLREALMKVFWSGGECHDILWSLWGISMAGWVFIALALLAGWAAYINWMRRD